jgi:phosphomannomutase
MANLTLSEKLSDIVDRLPEIHCSENIKIYLKNKDIEKKVQSIVEKAKFMNKEIEFFDGIKILDENGWIFFRQSRTEECLTIKFESYKKENFEKKRSEMEDFLKN